MIFGLIVGPHVLHGTGRGHAIASIIFGRHFYFDACVVGNLRDCRKRFTFLSGFLHFLFPSKWNKSITNSCEGHSNVCLCPQSASGKEKRQVQNTVEVTMTVPFISHHIG
jgi:hypothetical protein